MAPPKRSAGLSSYGTGNTTITKCAYWTTDKEQFLSCLKKVFQRLTGLYRTFLQRWTDDPEYCVHRFSLKGNGARNGRILMGGEMRTPKEVMIS
jgi:hypothetical protein